MLIQPSDASISQALFDRLVHPSLHLTAVVTGVSSPALSFGLESLVNATDGVCLAGAASTFEAFLQACARAGRCIALVDPQLGGEGIADFLDTLRRRAPKAMPVLLLGTAQPHAVREALRRGALGLVHLSADIDEIRSAVLAVADGRRHIPTDIASLLAESLTLEDLTCREMEVLGLLSQGRCNKSIARDLDVALGTVKTHVRAIMYKLGTSSRMGAILEANRRGLISIG
ncbi:response regulator transcription factor [Variovorax sp. JS1663]|uniref:response regulator transcription factor n=1 Tax=Variovorax sp. JS1663 TaxID=1851577 RepID=UPI000B3441B3|nr:response regulator transcription factor [Variovorax sp. JS1663]OUM02848.1 hypothetical protein A8M77_09645 [Variovorax sp. JS1663]